ncbi:hypothetical protein GCM10027578_33220 [Spirosoma luteolum]
MKNTFKRILLVGLSLVGAAASAQEWTFGPRFNLDLSNRQTANQVRLGAVSAVLGQIPEANAVGAGLFVRYDRPSWYGQAETNYMGQRVLNYYITGPAIGLSDGTPLFRLDGRLMGGYKPLPWLRLSGGLGVAHYIDTPGDKYADYIKELEGQLTANPQDPQIANELKARKVAQALQNSVRPYGLEAYLGVGVDIGGLTVDLTHRNTLISQLSDIIVEGQPYALRQHNAAWTLQVGYRLFPLKSHLLNTRKRSRAYERISKEIPFYRNEIHIAGGMQGEDIGSAFLYENRYTRYLTRRFGLSGGLNLLRRSGGSLPSQSMDVQLVTAARFLPLYSRRHTVGISAGPLLAYQTGVQVNSGQSGGVVSLTDQSAVNRIDLQWQGMVDYQFAVSDRLITGPWLRLSTDYVYAGVQVGYRF